MLSTQTVVQTDNETNIIVNSKYFPSSGTANDVGGIISANSKKNTVNETSIEIHKVTCQRYWKWNTRQLTTNTFKGAHMLSNALHFFDERSNEPILKLRSYRPNYYRGQCPGPKYVPKLNINSKIDKGRLPRILTLLCHIKQAALLYTSRDRINNDTFLNQLLHGTTKYHDPSLDLFSK
uniref:Uncharacterized protein n=1 Tax=Glossina austeni TaxID=7395 RepID=A0A1A9V642_GLOAU